MLLYCTSAMVTLLDLVGSGHFWGVFDQHWAQWLLTEFSILAVSKKPKPLKEKKTHQTKTLKNKQKKAWWFSSARIQLWSFGIPSWSNFSLKYSAFFVEDCNVFLIRSGSLKWSGRLARVGVAKLNSVLPSICLKPHVLWSDWFLLKGYDSVVCLCSLLYLAIYSMYCLYYTCWTRGMYNPILGRSSYKSIMSLWDFRSSWFLGYLEWWRAEVIIRGKQIPRYKAGRKEGSAQTGIEWHSWKLWMLKTVINERLKLLYIIVSCRWPTAL